MEALQSDNDIAREEIASLKGTVIRSTVNSDTIIMLSDENFLTGFLFQ